MVPLTNVELQQQIEVLEARIDKKNQELSSIIEFKQIPEATLIRERMVLREKLVAIHEKYGTQKEKLLKRHDAVLKNSQIRMERIINAADTCEADV